MMKRRTALNMDWLADGVEVDRRGNRNPVRIPAQLLRRSDRIAVLTICNLSRYGFMGEGTGRADIGETLTLEVEGAAAEVYVAWALGGRIGGEFVKPLDEAMLARIIERSSRDG